MRSAFKPGPLCSALLALGVATGPLGIRAGTVPADLAALRLIYDSHFAQFESEYNTEMDAWMQEYRRQVANLVQASQRAGNLDAWQWASRELQRFETEPQIPAEPPVGAPEPLLQLQARARPIPGQSLQRRFQKVSDLTSRYLARLKTLKTEATRAGRFEEAIAYDQEIRRVKALPVVVRAQDLLEAEAAAEAPAEPEPSAVDPPAEGLPPGTDRGLEIPEGVAFSEGLTPPAVPGLSFRPLSLDTTERMRVARTLSAQAELASTSESQRTSYSRSGSSEHTLRLWFRPSRSSHVVENSILVVEYYGRDLRERSSHIVPRSMALIRTRLPTLEGVRWNFVQLPPLSTSRTIYRSSFYYSGSRQGLEFYGVVVSVFDASGQLIYQGVSAANLVPLAPESMPELPAPPPERAAPPVWMQGGGAAVE